MTERKLTALIESKYNATGTEAAAQGFDKLAASADKNNAKLNQAGKTAKDSSLKFTELSSAINLVDRGLQLAGQAYDQTVGSASAYDRAMVLLAQNMGTTVEETSRLVQAADDFGITEGEVTAALQMAVKNGFLPTIDNLAKMADKYVSIQDPLKRADEMVKVFGRNWTALTPMLAKGGDAVKAQAAAISDGLIVTKQAVEAQEKYRVAMDDWNDTTEAAKIAIGNGLIPVMTDLINTTVLLFTWEEKLTNARNQQRTKTAETAKTYEEYSSALIAAAKATGYLVDEQGNLYWEDMSTGAHKVVQANYMYSKAAWEAQQITGDLGRELQKVANAELAASAVTQKFGSVLGGNTSIIQQSIMQLNEREKALLDNIAAQVEEQRALENVAFAVQGPLKNAYEDYSQTLDDLKTKEEEIVAALALAKKQGYSDTSDKVKGLTQDLNDNKQAQLDAAAAIKETTKQLIYQQASEGLSSEQARKLAVSLGIMSQTDYDAITAIEELKKRLADTKDEVGYREAILLLEQALADGKLTAAELERILMRMDGQNYKTTMTTTFIEEGAPQNQRGGEGTQTPTGPREKDDPRGPQQTFGGGGGSGGTSVIINQYFTNTDPNTVRTATRDGVNDSMRQQGDLMISYKLTAFGSQALPLRRVSQYSGAGSIRGQYTPMSGGGVYDAHGTDRQPAQGGSIPYSAALVLGLDGFTTAALFEAEERKLRALMGTEAKLYRVWDSSALTEWTYARCDSVNASRVAGNVRLLDFDFQFTQKQFCWNGVWHQVSFYDVGDAIDPDSLPRTGAESGTGAVTLTGITNSGNLPQHLLKITVTANGGAVTGFSLVNNTNGYTLSWAGTLADGHALIINSNDLTVTNDGTGEYSLLTRPTTKEHWFQLTTGANSITCTVTGGPASVVFEYYAAHA